MTALVLFSHGSLLCGAGEALDAHAARLRDAGGWDRVEVGYLNYSAPSLEETVAKLAGEGVSTIRILPYFLIPGYFVGKALPDALNPLRARFAGIEITVAEPIGYDPRLADALLEFADAARPPKFWREPLARAGSSCRNRPDCPLYSTANCPASMGGNL